MTLVQLDEDKMAGSPHSHAVPAFEDEKDLRSFGISTGLVESSKINASKAFPRREEISLQFS